MVKVLCLFSTREGQTKKILNTLARQIRDHRFHFENIHEMPIIDFSQYNKVLIGASVRYGHFNKRLYHFIKKNYLALEGIPSAFICISLMARKESEGKDKPERNIYVKKFLSKSPWEPKLIGVFAGALLYPKYNLVDRVIIRLIMKMTQGETDPSQEVEYTNWTKVREFGKDFESL